MESSSKRHICVNSQKQAVRHIKILDNALWLMYWNNIQEFMDKFQLEHTSGQWMLFTVSSNFTMKTMSLHNGNKVTSVPLVQAIHTTQTHEYLQVFFAKITLIRTLFEYMCWPKSYSNFDCVCRHARTMNFGSLKVSQSTDCHYRTEKCSLRSETTQGQKNVVYPIFRDVTIYLPSLHIKWTLTKMPEGMWRI